MPREFVRVMVQWQLAPIRAAAEAAVEASRRRVREIQEPKPG
ncbi:MAG: hypothetical protein ABSB01_20785 [Streptosporangiaceae bacterium]|jgi:hypothetical protein